MCGTASRRVFVGHLLDLGLVATVVAHKTEGRAQERDQGAVRQPCLAHREQPLDDTGLVEPPHEHLLMAHRPQEIYLPS